MSTRYAERSLQQISTYVSPKEKKHVSKSAGLALRSESDYVRLLIEQDMKSKTTPKKV